MDDGMAAEWHSSQSDRAFRGEDKPMKVSSPAEMVGGRHTREHRALLPEQGAALEAIAGVVLLHLEQERKNPVDGAAPMLIQLDGPGNGELVNMLARQLVHPRADDSRSGELDGRGSGVSYTVARPEQQWSVIRFDAWQYQCVAPPWWWLVAGFDDALREQFRCSSASVARRKRLRDYGWRVGQFLKDLLPVLPLVAAALVLWFISGQLAMSDFLKWSAGFLGGLTTLAAFLWSATNAVRRLLVASPASGTAVTRTRDPMADLKLRYSFLIRSSDRPLLLVIDNLDRCCADYVVELLEGLQTLLTNPEADSDTRLVAVLIPAARGWLCESYVQVYKDFGDAMRQPGRPFGLAFVDRVFDLALRLPPVVPTDEHQVAPTEALKKIGEADGEGRIRDVVADLEQRFGTRPVARLRLAAVCKLGRLEVKSNNRVCFDTARVLKELVRSMPVGATVVNQLRTAYCVQRTTQLLGGHPIDRGEKGIRRLGLWTILDLRWPLLTQHLARNPDHVDLLRTQASPPSITEDLAQVFSDPEAARLATIAPGLTSDDVRRFTRSYVAAESCLPPTDRELALR